MVGKLGHKFGLLLMILTLPASLWAITPLTINYQGRVLGPDGSPAPGPVDITLTIWDDSTAGNKLYEEQHRSTPLTDGVFDVLIGAGSDQVGNLAADTFMASARWLELTINGEPLSPRQPFSSVAYSLQAEHAASADTVGDLAADALVPRSGGTFTGVVGINGPNGKGNILLSHLTTQENNGYLSVQDANGMGRVNAFVNSDGNGTEQTLNAAGHVGTALTSGANGGQVGVYDAQGNAGATMFIGTGGGFVATYDVAGNLGAYFVTDTTSGIVGVERPDGASALMTARAADAGVVIYDPNDNPKAGMLINASNQGAIFADIKNFVVDYPNRPGFQIMYASFEGPEAAIDCRGTVSLSHGHATIELPDHFTAMASPGTITVQLTPESLDSQGLGFQRASDGSIEIGELHDGQGSSDVDFLVHAVRRGYEDY